jgi:hypothetical protein
MSAKKPAIIYIKRDRLDYWNNDNPQPLSFLFPPDQVKDMEVLNATAFEISLQSFIERSKISPCKITIILSDQVYFEKQLPDNIAAFEKDDVINSFLDIVPFENVSKRVIRHDGHSFIVCINADIWQAIKTTFTSQGSMITAILPSFAFGIPELKSNFDPSFAKPILAKADNLKESNFLDVVGSNTPSSNSKTVQPNNHVRELILGFVFLALLSVFIILVIVQKPFSPATPQPLVLPTVTPALSPPLSQATSYTRPEVAGITDSAFFPVRIWTSHNNETQADSLLSLLLQKGYKEIKIDFNLSRFTPAPELIIPDSLSISERDTLIVLCKKFLPDFTVSSSPSSVITIHF